MRGKHTFIILFFVMIPAGLVCAQELQVPLDEKGKSFVITPEVARRTGQFQYVHMFQEARVYQLPDSSYVLEIHYLKDWRMYKERRPLSIAELTDIRGKMMLLSPESRDPLAPSPAARVRFVTGMMFLGLGFYGWAVPVIVEPDDEHGAVGLYFVSSGLTFLTAYYATPASGIPEAAGMLGLYGGTRGILHGFALHQWIDKDSNWDDEDEGQGMLASGMIVSVMETMAGYGVAQSSRMLPGTAGVIGACGDFGLLVGGATGSLIGKGIDRQKDYPPHHYYTFDEHWDSYDSDDDAHIYQRRWTMGGVIVGSAAGMLTGAALAQDEPYTKGDGRVLRAAGLLGIAAAFSFNDLFNEQAKDKTEAALIAGPIAGVAAGHLITKGKDFSSEQGTIVFLHTLTGGLLGLGVSQIVANASDDEEKHSIVYVTAVGMAGFYLGYRTFLRSAKSAAMLSDVDFHVTPTSLMTQDEQGRRHAVPGVNVMLRF